MSKPIDTILARRAELRAAASPGPWTAHASSMWTDSGYVEPLTCHDDPLIGLADAKLIAEAACPVRSERYDAVMRALARFPQYAQHTPICDERMRLCTGICECGLDAARDELLRAVEALEGKT